MAFLLKDVLKTFGLVAFSSTSDEKAVSAQVQFVPFKHNTRDCDISEEWTNLHDSNVHGANMGPTWGRQDPGGPHVGPMNFAVWGWLQWKFWGRWLWSAMTIKTCSHSDMRCREPVVFICKMLYQATYVICNYIKL